MKLLQINSVVNYGSTGHIAEDIGALAQKYGFESTIAYGRYPKKSSSNLIRIGNDLDVKIHGVKTRLFDKHGFGSYFATKRFIKELKKCSPSIIHLHNIHGYYLNVSVLFKFLKKQNVPIVWTLHDCWTMTGHCSHFSSAKCFKWQKGCYKCPLLNKYPKSLFDNSKHNYKIKKDLFTGIKNLTIVTPSKWLCSVVEQSYLKEYPIRVINNGINLDVFKPCSSKDSSFMILGVASVWEDSKGLKDFIKLSSMISSDEKIVLVGLSKDQISNLPKNIIGIERTESQNALAELYSKASVFVNPTYEDTFPTTNLEALACGTPVVTYEGTGSVEAIDENTGFVVPLGDVDALYKAIQSIKLKGVESYIDGCSLKAKKNYDKTECFEKYIELYKSLLK